MTQRKGKMFMNGANVRIVGVIQQKPELFPVVLVAIEGKFDQDELREALELAVSEL